MQPDNQFTQPQPPSTEQAPVPMSYLDQIAAKPVVNKLPFGKKVMMLGLIVVVLIFAMIIISIIPKKVDPVASLAGRLTATKEIAEGSASRLKSSQLRSMNSNLRLYLSNTIRDITPFLTAQKIEIAKLDPKILAEESNVDLLARLEEARLNAVYDRTYAREMAYKLSTIIALIDQSILESASAEFKTFLTTAKTNLTPTQEQFADFNAANS